MCVCEQPDRHGLEPNALPCAARTLHAVAQTGIHLGPEKPCAQGDADRQRYDELRPGMTVTARAGRCRQSRERRHREVCLLFRPELTNWPSGTHKGTEQERHAAFLNGSGGMRRGLNPLWFSDAFCRATQRCSRR